MTQLLRFNFAKPISQGYDTAPVVPGALYPGQTIAEVRASAEMGQVQRIAKVYLYRPFALQYLLACTQGKHSHGLL